VVRNLARGSRHRFLLFFVSFSARVLASALCVKCGPTGPPRPSEGEDVDPWVEVLPSGFQRTFCAFPNFFRSSRVEVLPVASEVLRTSPSQRPPRLLKATCGRSPRAAPGVESGAIPPSSPSSTTASPLSAALRRRAWLRLSSTGLHDFTVFTTTQRSTRLPASAFIPIVATLQRLEGVAVDVLTSRTWFCRSSLRAV
jgi:hypothetical protein